MTEPITCGLGLCSAGIVESFNQFRDFIALICIIGLMSFRFSFGFYRFTLLLILFCFLFFQDLSENHPSQEPMGPCSSERVSWLKIKKLKKKKNTRVLEWEQGQTGCSGGFFEGCE